MKALNGEQIFTCMSDLDPRLVTEALPPSMRAGAAGVPARRVRRASAFWSSGWTAAILSGVVALGVLIAIIVAGQNGSGQPPVVTQAPTLTKAPLESEDIPPQSEPETGLVAEPETETEPVTESETETEPVTEGEIETEIETVDLMNIMPSPKLQYSYSDSGTHIPKTTQDVQIFAEHVLPTDAIEVTITLSYDVPDCNCLSSITPGMTAEEVDDIRHNHNTHMKELHTQHNQQFIRGTSFVTDASDYRLIVPMYSPFVQLRFETYDLFVGHLREIAALIENDDVSVIRVNVLKEAL